MKPSFLLITIIGAIILASCRDETQKKTEGNNSITVVVVDSQVPTMYQNPDTLAFIRQSITKNSNPDSIKEVKMYFGVEAGQKWMVDKLKIEINGAANLCEPLRKTDIAWHNSNENLGIYCQKLAVLCDTLIGNQRRILDILNKDFLNEDYGDCNFYSVITYKNGITWEEAGTITEGRCVNYNGELWDLSKMNR